jgi:hypothetical protein
MRLQLAPVDAVCACIPALPQIANTYFFLINGFPKQLWDTLPTDLHPTDKLLARIDAAEAARPEGNTAALPSRASRCTAFVLPAEDVLSKVGDDEWVTELGQFWWQLVHTCNHCAPMVLWHVCAAVGRWCDH